MIYYTIYRVTNKINGKVYIGSHKTKNLNDTYMGSGKYLNHAIKKHGIENFYKEVLFVFDNPADMYAKEAELVDDEFLAETNTYNLRLGGMGGFDYVNRIGKNGSAEGRLRAGRNTSRSPRRKLPSTEQRLKGIATQRDTLAGSYFDPALRKAAWKKSMSKAARQKRQQTFAERKHQQGEKNSQFGKRWITNGIQNLKISKTERIPEGWRFGRTMPL